MHEFENLKCLRRFLKLTQQEFIQRFFRDAAGDQHMSVSRLSLLENGRGGDAERGAEFFCREHGVAREELEADPLLFARRVAEFAERHGFEAPRPAPAAPAGKPGGGTEELVKSVSEYLTSRLLDGQIRPGDKLPAERELAKTLNTGRSALREALRVLAVIGLLSIRPGQGTFVAARHTDFFDSSLAWNLLISEHSHHDILEVRMTLECEAALLAARRRTPEDLAVLEQLAGRMLAAAQSGNQADFLEADMDFHLAVARAAQNRTALHLLSTIRKISGYYSRRGMASREDRNDIYTEHTAVFAAIAAEDAPAARAAMQRHLSLALRRYV
ncbi:MAG: FadR family transcriptional regulator [Gracilibacteraceae bacterium]|jgi:DNA-binding FadR family transcriptional regulator|nr:FadR family transcriptional regulator [Gracilibacteraceae bacterium]